MRTTATLTTLAAAALLAACASTPTLTPQLQQARAAVRSAETDPAVVKYAPLELKKAADSLNRANDLSAKREALADIDSAAYVAAAQARTAQALARAQTDEDAIRTAEADRERARADANARRASAAQAQAESARAAAAAASAAASAARQQAASASADADAARQQAASAQAQAAALQKELADLQAKQTDRGMLVTLGDVLFEFGRAEIKPAAQASLAKLADYLKQHPDRRALIEGFTDSVGSDAANLALSERRAQSVADALVALGVDAGRLDKRGYGKQYPVASNASTSDRAMNRRVEVYISNDNQPVRARS
ncbi:MAG: OmpA family protein [Roseateles sp.]|uniref:OmpA family protein n=1 Tax=Roseateles sp. TaxID=1971397 RepID=UPI0039E7C00F